MIPIAHNPNRSAKAIEMGLHLEMEWHNTDTHIKQSHFSSNCRQSIAQCGCEGDTLSLKCLFLSTILNISCLIALEFSWQASFIMLENRTLEQQQAFQNIQTNRNSVGCHLKRNGKTATPKNKQRWKLSLSYDQWWFLRHKKGFSISHLPVQADSRTELGKQGNKNNN